MTIETLLKYHLLFLNATYVISYYLYLTLYHWFFLFLYIFFTELTENTSNTVQNKNVDEKNKIDLSSLKRILRLSRNDEEVPRFFDKMKYMKVTRRGIMIFIVSLNGKSDISEGNGSDYETPTKRFCISATSKECSSLQPFLREWGKQLTKFFYYKYQGRKQQGLRLVFQYS